MKEIVLVYLLKNCDFMRVFASGFCLCECCCCCVRSFISTHTSQVFLANQSQCVMCDDDGWLLVGCWCVVCGVVVMMGD